MTRRHIRNLGATCLALTVLLGAGCEDPIGPPSAALPTWDVQVVLDGGDAATPDSEVDPEDVQSNDDVDAPDDAQLSHDVEPPDDIQPAPSFESVAAACNFTLSPSANKGKVSATDGLIWGGQQPNKMFLAHACCPDLEVSFACPGGEYVTITWLEISEQGAMCAAGPGVRTGLYCQMCYTCWGEVHNIIRMRLRLGPGEPWSEVETADYIVVWDKEPLPPEWCGECEWPE